MIPIIKTDKGYVAVSDETPAKNYTGYYALDKKVFHTSQTMLQSGCKAIILTDNTFKLDGVPQFELDSVLNQPKELIGIDVEMEITPMGQLMIDEYNVDSYKVSSPKVTNGFVTVTKYHYK